ncbi:unnamed protein product [Trichogramma brassicae]|uniref:Uncharacterized protein n=1 Tax=Trichogramma brassicae TaxID=86971 RepID=A0A6H5I392_9HYME|nr:unnamed protein product [Trichogramma brassicae]
MVTVTIWLTFNEYLRVASEKVSRVAGALSQICRPSVAPGAAGSRSTSTLSTRSSSKAPPSGATDPKHRPVCVRRKQSIGEPAYASSVVARTFRTRLPTSLQAHRRWPYTEKKSISFAREN